MVLEPTEIEISPPSPPAAVPVPIDKDPELPLDVVPELNTSTPLIPAVPASGVLIVIEPELVDVPAPETTDTCPPVLASPTPPKTCTLPPS